MVPFWERVGFKIEKRNVLRVPFVFFLGKANRIALVFVGWGVGAKIIKKVVLYWSLVVFKPNGTTRPTTFGYCLQWRQSSTQHADVWSRCFAVLANPEWSLLPFSEKESH
jgi:hypothetical protein